MPPPKKPVRGKITKAAKPFASKPVDSILVDQISRPSAKQLEIIESDKANRKYKLSKMLKDGSGPSRISPVAAHLRMHELGFDPLAMSVAIAKGEALQVDHPFLAELTGIILELEKDLEDGKPIDWFEKLDTILTLARQSLAESYTPLKLRSDHVRDLLTYLYPKLKATDHSGTIKHALMIKPLAPEEVNLFKRKFYDEY